MELKQALQDYYDFWFLSNYLYEEWAKRKGLSMYGLFVLQEIKENRNCTAKQICNRLFLPKQTVNAILNSFENKGLIRRVAMEQDRRNKEILFTRDGKRYADNILQEMYEAEEKALQKMGEEQMEAMAQNNRIFIKCLEETMRTGDKKEIAERTL